MKRAVLAIIFLLVTIATAPAETRVWLMRGMGGNWGGLAPGVDNIAALERRIPGVTSVRVFEYYQTQQIADEIVRTPLRVNVVIGGYSCGANSATVIASVMRRPVNVEAIQASTWCGGVPLGAAVARAQETYNPQCLWTFGLGCKKYVAGPGFRGQLLLVNRPDGHLKADDDPDAQADMVRFVRAVEAQKLGAARIRSSGVHEIVRYHGQRPY